ncbi:GAF domain-containing protein [Dysgonomonas macrotermitis]|uniref:GAF domain-containing protein n=1 Tax=Dysgonomonas macrotermitis TaxID=1346286 RepID=A0A1M5AUF1_9BACT|nr:GAF domain-containing protein [Dysgonomonas macrotermitis]SHF33881.1 GAF domain-containing protein [Dysgonomonas macrotermitis]
MAEKLDVLQTTSREEQYKNLLPQVEALISYETDLIANMANLSAVLREAFGFLWVGFYIVRNKELVLGPFQGKIACTRIGYGKGVCGTAWKENKPLVVPDVDAFPGHITCDGDSRSEVVLPLNQDGKVIGVLDIDSQFLNHFSETDVIYLQKFISFLSVSRLE